MPAGERLGTTTRNVIIEFYEEDIAGLRRLAEARNSSMRQAVQGVIATEALIREIYGSGKTLITSACPKPVRHFPLRILDWLGVYSHLHRIELRS